jgi:hypothetical protein
MPIQGPSKGRVSTALAMAGIGVTVMGASAVYPIVGVTLLVVAIGIVIWPMVVKSTRALETISFDYMPGSPQGNPLQEGWKVAYGPVEQMPEFQVVQDPMERDSLEMIAHPNYAIQYMLSPATAAATRRVRLAIRYSDATMFWLLVQLSSKNGTNRVDRQLKIKLQGGSPRRPEQHPDYPSERTAWVPARALGDGWVALDLDVRELVSLAWGGDGWVHNALRGIQLRGNIAVSPIAMLEPWW